MKAHQTYASVHTDFTPFVSVAFLLILFFMWQKEVQRLNQMRVELPDQTKTFCGEYPVADASLFLLANNRVGYLNYKPGATQAEFVETNYSIDGIQALLLFLSITSKKASGTVIMVKPTDQATIKNIVDIISAIRTNTQIRFNLTLELNQSDRRLLQEYYRLRGKRLLPALKKVILDPSWHKGG